MVAATTPGNQETVIPFKGLNNNGVPKPYTSKMKFMIRQHDIFDIFQMILSAPRRVVACAAEVYQYLWQWTQWKQETQRTSWIYKPLQEIEADLRAYSVKTIRWAIKLLMDVDILERRNDPGHKLNRTYQYKLNVGYVESLRSTSIAEDSEQGESESAESRMVVDLAKRKNAFAQQPNAFAQQPNAFGSGDQIKQSNSISIPTNIEVTTNSAVVDEEEFLDTEENPYQSTFVNPADVKVNEKDLVEDEVGESTQQEFNPREDEYSPAPRDVNQVETVSGVNDVKSVSNDVLSEVEQLVGDEYSPQLERLVLSTQIEVVRNAIAFVKQKLATKGTEIRRKAGYLTNAIKNRLEPSSPVQQPRSSSQEQKYPPGFLEWYEQASANKWVDGRSPRHLSRMNGGEPLVFVLSQKRSMPWYEAQAWFLSQEQADSKPNAEPEQF